MQLSKFKTALQTEKEEIMLFIKNNRNFDIDLDGDETDVIQAKIIARAAAEVLIKKQEKLMKIDLAMKKIENGDFGLCEECEEEINEKRLIFNPGFNLCITCAEHNERLKKNNIR